MMDLLWRTALFFVDLKYRLVQLPIGERQYRCSVESEAAIQINAISFLDA